MWVSQTYLTNLTAEGAVAAYWLSESYRDDHNDVLRAVLPLLGNLARTFGDHAHVFIPSSEDRSPIEKEFNDWLKQRGHEPIMLPGVLVLEHAMKDDRSLHGSASFVSFAPLLDLMRASEAFRQVAFKNGKLDSNADLARRRKVDELLGELKIIFDSMIAELNKEKGGLEKAFENLQLKPGIWGVGYDLKPQLIKFIAKLRK